MLVDSIYRGNGRPSNKIQVQWLQVGTVAVNLCSTFLMILELVKRTPFRSVIRWPCTLDKSHPSIIEVNPD